MQDSDGNQEDQEDQEEEEAPSAVCPDRKTNFQV
jgi:hypothetical protein